MSVGRTNAESDVRVEIDDMLAQMDTRAIGIHGDLERCQDIMIELAHLGIGEVRCVLPNTADIDDVIAQLTATTVGTTDILKPGAARSEAPAPPPGWGAAKPQKEQSVLQPRVEPVVRSANRRLAIMPAMSETSARVTSSSPWNGVWLSSIRSPGSAPPKL